MPQQIIYTDGQKSLPLWEDGPYWTNLSGSGTTPDREMMSRVAAASAARDLTATAVSNVPFVIVETNNGDEVDNIADWQNVLKFMPKPKDLIKRLELSLMDNNGAYLRMGKNVFEVAKQLHYVKYNSIKPVTDPATGNLLYLERWVNGTLEKKYAPDDKSLVRFWILDDTTELLPSLETETLSVLSATGIIFYSDLFTQSFYKRGGIKPTLIAMKGMVSKEKKEELQKDWTSFIRGIGRTAWQNVAKIFQAEAMDIKAFGDGLGDLKETPVYRQALENIAIGRRMPLSILLANSANRATADTETVLWFRNKIVPSFDFIAENLNEQIFEPMGLQMQNRAETIDPEQEDEVSRVGALSGYGDALAKYPDAETFLTAAQGVFGYELPDDHIAAIEAYYAKKKENAEAITANMNKQPANDTQPSTDAPQEDVPVVEEQPVPPAKWIPSLDEMNELRVWREVALRRFKKGESLAFEYQPHYGGLPKDIARTISNKLSLGTTFDKIQTAEDIKAIFDIEYPAQDGMLFAPEVKAQNELLKIVGEALNRLADGKQ